MCLDYIANASASANLALVGICSKNSFFFATADSHYNIRSPKFNNVTNNSVKQSSQYLSLDSIDDNNSL